MSTNGLSGLLILCFQNCHFETGLVCMESSLSFACPLEILLIFDSIAGFVYFWHCVASFVTNLGKLSTPGIQ